MEVPFSKSVFPNIILLILFITNAGVWEEDSFESDRGNREPAVIGPPIIDESVGNSEDRVEGTSESENVFWL